MGYVASMQTALAALPAPVAEAVRATAGAVVGRLGESATGTVTTFGAVLTIDEDASVPSGVSLLQPGASHRAVVQVGPDRPGREPRRLSVKIPDAYAPGKDQDFLLSSSGDGAPLHHAVVPSDPVATLYSSLWLYLVGVQPLLFGVRPPTTGPDVRFGTGDDLAFLVSPAVGRFRRIATLTLDEQLDARVDFSGSSSGGNIRPLPPVNFY